MCVQTGETSVKIVEIFVKTCATTISHISRSCLAAGASTAKQPGFLHPNFHLLSPIRMERSVASRRLPCQDSQALMSTPVPASPRIKELNQTHLIRVSAATAPTAIATCKIATLSAKR
jgi:hypothetical protein